MNKRLIPFAVTGGIMAVTALLLVSATDSYDSFFWTRFVWCMLDIILAAVGIMRALTRGDGVKSVRCFAGAVMFLIGCAVVLFAVKQGWLMFMLSLVLYLAYIVIMVTTAMLEKRDYYRE